jgi:hypothetical protein
VTPESLMPRKTTPTLKLTDTQLVLLSAAALRQDRALERPETMTARAFARALNGLLKAGLVEQRACVENSSDGGAARVDSVNSSVTSAGLAAIDLEPDTAPAHDQNVDWIVGGELVLTPPTDDALPQGPTTKRALIIAMLSRSEGATLADLMAATGWLAHTTRAALTGLRHTGFRVERSRPDDAPAIYRIVAEVPERAA